MYHATGRSVVDGPSGYGWPYPRDEPIVTPDITSSETFETALDQLIAAAVANGVHPAGTFQLRNGDGKPDWEVEVVELEKPD